MTLERMARGITITILGIAGAALCPIAHAGLSSLGPSEDWIAVVKGDPPRVPVTLFAINKATPLNDPGYVHYWLTPCANDMWNVPAMNLDGTIDTTKIHAPSTVLFDQQRVQLGDDKIPGPRNGKFRKLSAQEAWEACRPMGGPTMLSLEGWQIYLQNHDWYALEVEYMPRYPEKYSWDNGTEHVAARLKVTNIENPDKPFTYTLDSYYVSTIPGNCLRELSDLQLKWKIAQDDYMNHVGSNAYQANSDLYDAAMKINSEVLLLKLRATEGSCSAEQAADIEALSLDLLGRAAGALAYMISVDNANAAALDALYNSVLAAEKCLVRGGIKLGSKILQNHPLTMGPYKIVDAVVGGYSGYTMMELGVKVGDMVVVNGLGGGQEPTGCAAAIVSMGCRVITDSLWNKGQLNVRVAENKKTVKLIDNIHNFHRPGYALPSDQSIQVVATKGYMGLGNLGKAKNVCEKFRELYFSTLGTVFRDTGELVEACTGADTGPFGNAVNAVRELGIRCSSALRILDKLVPPPGGAMPPPPGGGGTTPPPTPPMPPPGGMPPPG